MGNVFSSVCALIAKHQNSVFLLAACGKKYFGGSIEKTYICGDQLNKKDNGWESTEKLVFWGLLKKYVFGGRKGFRSSC